MKIALEIPADRIANLMTSAIESGDPVTTASRGGWCNGITCRAADGRPNWYAEAATYEKPFAIDIFEVDDETTGHITKHRVRPSDFARGLIVMSQKFPDLFGQILKDDTDAPCADIFLQCVLFGEEKYA